MKCSRCEEEALSNNKLCFTCNFWTEKVRKKYASTSVRINQIHYFIDVNEERKSHCKGFGGAKFVIKFFDGRIVTTTNLWCQGTVPDDFRNDLPDNAEFIKEPNLRPNSYLPA